MSDASRPAPPPESGAPPDLSPGDRPRDAEMYVAAVVVTLLSALLLWGAVSPREETAADLGEVAPARALDRKAAPAGAFVTVSGHPDATRIGYAYSAGPWGQGDVMLVLHETPGLIIYCQQSHPLTQAAHRSRRGPGREVTDGPLLRSWTIGGRICDGARTGGQPVQIPEDEVRRFARENLGLKSDEEFRVLVAGATPRDARAAARNAFLFALFMGAVAVLLWVICIRSTLQRRRRPT